MLRKYNNIILLFLLMAAGPAFSSGYFMTGHGARAMGKGGTGMTDAGNSMALFYNPALLPKIKGLRLYLNTTYAYNFTDIETGDLNYSVFVDKDKKKDEEKKD